MIGKTDWAEHLHAIRKKEVELVFSILKREKFISGLEIGAGDGYQGTLLAPHFERFISSDLNFKRIKESLKVTGVEYRVLDADVIQGVFPDAEFDFIFSSNVLEHLADPFKFLFSTQPMLMDNGYAVHIVPSRHIKLFYLLFYYPNLLLLAIDRLIDKMQGKPFFQGENINLENNINILRPVSQRTSRWKKFLWPSPHGNFSTHWQEYAAFGRKNWERLFKEAGYSITAHVNGPAFSGYGFGLPDFLRKLPESLGVSSEHIFVLKKMTQFESEAWAYTKSYLPRGSFYEQKKFVRDWLKKEKNAKAFKNDFQKAVGDVRGKKVLDVGFGNGIMLLEFARAGAEAYGLETENSLLRTATKHFKDNKHKARLEVYDGKIFPFPNNVFDYAYSTSVLEHMSYPQEVLSEIARTLVQGGKFYLSFPNKYAPKESHTGLWFISWLPRSVTQEILSWTKSSPLEDWNLHFISYFSMKKMARKAGLRVVYDMQSSSHIKRLIKKVLASLGLHYGILLKTIIIVLEKPLKK